MQDVNWGDYLNKSPRISVFEFALNIGGAKIVEDCDPLPNYEDISFDYADSIILALCDLFSTNVVCLVGGELSSLEAFRKQKNVVLGLKHISSLGEDAQYIRKAKERYPEENDKLDSMRLGLNEVWVKPHSAVQGLAQFPAFRQMLPKNLFEYISGGANYVDSGHRKPGGSNRDTPRIEATKTAIAPVFNDLGRYLDLNGKIRVNDFCEQVKVSMASKGTADMFHESLCRKWAQENLGRHKLRVGEKLQPKTK